MPLEMFIKLDGINGDSKNFAFKGWSQIISWDWGMSNVVKEVDSVKKYVPVFKELQFNKLIGSDTPDLMMHFAQSKKIKEAELNIIPVIAKRGDKEKYMAMKMENVLIKSIMTGGDASQSLFTETILLQFGKLKFEFSQNFSADKENPKGSSKDFVFSWDIRSSQEWH